MSPPNIVRTLLKQAPGEAVCNACLAFACSTSLSEMLALTGELAGDDEFISGPGPCVGCRRTTATIAYGQVGRASSSRPRGRG